MTPIRSAFNVPDPASSPAARWSRGGRVAAASVLVLGAGFQLAANSIGPQEKASSTLDQFRWALDHAATANLIYVFALLAAPFSVGTALVYVLLSRQRAPRLAHTGGALLGFGLVALAAVEGYQTLAIALISDGRIDLKVLAAVIDGSSSPAVTVMFVMFIPFAFFGLLISAAALWLSGAVPRGAVALIPAYIVVDFFLREGFGLVPEFAGPAVAFVAACWIAWAVMTAGVGPRKDEGVL